VPQLAVVGGVAASRENVAFSRLRFLYHGVLHLELPAIEKVERAKRPARVPETLSREEARAFLWYGDRTPRLVPSLLYGSRLRLMECIRLCVTDIGVARSQFTLREGRDERTRTPRSGWRIGLAIWRSGSRTRVWSVAGAR
jgi:integrase